MESVRGHCKATANSERCGEWRTLNRKKLTANCVLIHFIEINANFNVDVFIYAVKKYLCLVLCINFVVLKFIV